LNRVRNLLTSLLGLAALAALSLAVVWVYRAQGAVPTATTQTGSAAALAPDSPRPSPVESESSRSVQAGVPGASIEQPTVFAPEPIPTVPPFPTAAPTPAVTPIPLSRPPFISDLRDVAPSVSRLLVREGNKVWMMDGSGGGRTLLIDTLAKAGLYLGHSPLRGTDVGPYPGWGAISPDNRQLALVLTSALEVEEQGQEYSWDIYVLGVESGDFERLAEGIEPEWSPDGSRIAYIRGRSLLLMDMTTGAEKELVATPVGFCPRELQWSSDGRLAFVQSFCGHDHASIIVLDVDTGSQLLQWTEPDNRMIWRPLWTPDGGALVFRRMEDSPTGEWAVNLIKLDLGTLEATPVTHGAHVVSAALSPSSSGWIAWSGFHLYGDRQYDLWLAGLDGESTLRLTEGGPWVTDLEWSHDGTKLAGYEYQSGVVLFDLLSADLSRVFEQPLAPADDRSLDFALLQ